MRPGCRDPCEGRVGVCLWENWGTVLEETFLNGMVPSASSKERRENTHQPRLEANKPTLDDVDSTHSILPSHLVEGLEELERTSHGLVPQTPTTRGSYYLKYYIPHRN